MGGEITRRWMDGLEAVGHEPGLGFFLSLSFFFFSFWIDCCCEQRLALSGRDSCELLNDTQCQRKNDE